MKGATIPFPFRWASFILLYMVIPRDVDRSLPAGSAQKGALKCVVCGKGFSRPPHLVPRAKVCTRSGSSHRTKYETRPDGSAQRIPCACCFCIYKKALSKVRDLSGKLIPSARIPEFLEKVEASYGHDVQLAFRVGLNAMLRVSELSNLQVAHFRPNARPLPQLDVLALKKRAKLLHPVDLDRDTVRALAKNLGARRKGSIFDLPVRSLQRYFKVTVREMKLEKLWIHSLRHTGIWNQARSVTNLNDLNYLTC